MRRYDIDSLRVIVFGLLIFYHVGMFFVLWDYHIKDTETHDGFVFPMLFLNQWRLSLLFVISGIGTCYALRKRNGLQFAQERIKKLLIPLIVGIILVVPPQVYFERLDKNQFNGNYFEFWPTEAFIGVYPEGNFSWHHLWFLPYLLIFSLILIPVFLHLKKHPETWLIRQMQSLGSKNFGLYVLIIPLFLWETLLAPVFPSNHALFNDWYNLVNYGTFFFFGYLFVSIKNVFWETVEKNKYKYLVCGLIAFPLLMVLWFATSSFPGKSYVFSFCQSIQPLVMDTLPDRVFGCISQ